MNLEEFNRKLQELKKEYEKAYSKGCSLEELEKYISMKLNRPKPKGLKSLKGLFL